MKKTLRIIAMLALMFGMTSVIVSCGDDDKKDEPYKSKTYAHYSLKVGADLTYFYKVNITYKTLDGTERHVVLNEGQTEWKFDETSDLDCPGFKCYIELVARENYDASYTAADLFDFGYEYKCTAYSPTVGIKISSNQYTNKVERGALDEFMISNPTRVIIEFPQEY